MPATTTKSTIKSELQNKSWTRNQYYVSTDPSRIPVETLIEWFASDDFYWANTLSEDVMRETIQNSLCFGLYKTHQQHHHDDTARDTANARAVDGDDELVGVARCVTDFTTFVYLTDVYIPPVHQGGGLGKWLISCVQEVIESMPHLRRSMLFTSDWERSVPFYEKHMDMTVFEGRRGRDERGGSGPAMLMRKGRAAPGRKDETG